MGQGQPQGQSAGVSLVPVGLHREAGLSSGDPCPRPRPFKVQPQKAQENLSWDVGSLSLGLSGLSRKGAAVGERELIGRVTKPDPTGRPATTPAPRGAEQEGPLCVC